MNTSPHTDTPNPLTGGMPERDEAMSMPLGVGIENEAMDGSLDPLAGGSGGKRINTGAILIALVIVVAGGGLFAMRTIARASAHMKSNAEVESTIESFLSMISGTGSSSSDQRSSVLLTDDSSTINVLSEQYTEQQVPLSDVQRNPFVLFDAPTTGTGPVGPDLGTQRARVIAEREQQFEAAASRLMLTSVLMGSTPLANIDGKIVRTGETIFVEPDAVTFRVGRITSNSVVLIAEDPALGLSVEHRLTIRRDS